MSTARRTTGTGRGGVDGTSPGRPHLSFALADAGHLERLFATAGFREISMMGETRESSYESFDDYWGPIEAGAGSLPQAYRALPAPSRRAVREEVQVRLAAFETGGRLGSSSLMRRPPNGFTT